MHPLLQQVRTVGSRARRLVLGRAFAWWFCVVLLAVTIASLSDFLLRYQEAPLRWMMLGTVVLVTVVAWAKLIAPVLLGRWEDRYVAQRIERYFPEFEDRLSSAVAFLKEPEGDERFGSDVLRGEVIKRTTELAAQRDLLAVLDPRLVRPAWTALAAISLGAGLLIGANQTAGLLALRRLAMPWRQEAWPKQHQLSFVNPPTVLAYGQDFEVELVDQGGSFPDEVSIWYWFEGQSEEEARNHSMSFVGGKMMDRLPGVTRSFRYRAVGGDDVEMPWQSLRVIVPPKLVHSKITVRPPAYAGRSVVSTERSIRGLAGSVVEIEALWDRPIAAATLRFETAKSTRTFRTSIAADGRKTHLSSNNGSSWTLDDSGTYGWEVTDLEGLTVRVEDEAEVEVVPDLPPVISLESPSPNAAFTRRAQVPLRFQVKDDLAISKVTLQLGELSEVLATYSPPDGLSKGNAPSATTMEYLWDLAQQRELSPGATLSFHATAADYRPQDSQPAAGMIRIISDDEFERLLDQNQAKLLALLTKALEWERGLHAHTSGLSTQLKSQDQLTEADSAIWPTLEPGQRRVLEAVSGSDGAHALNQKMQHELAVNRWESSPLLSHLQGIESELAKLSRELLPPIQQELFAAERQLRFESPDYELIRRAWEASASGQQKVITALENLVDRLSQWDRFDNLTQEVRNLLDEQAQLADVVEKAATLGRDLSQLTPEERTQLSRAAQRLNELASQVDRLQARLDQLDERLRDSNPTAAKTLQKALEVLQREPVAGDLREAARDVADNRLGSARRDLQRAESGLRSVLETLDASAGSSPQELEKRLAKALDGLMSRQESLLKETSALSKQAERSDKVAAEAEQLGKTQGSLAEEVTGLVEQVPSASGYRMALELAADPMRQASHRLTKSEVDDATVKLQQAALDYLRDVASSFAQQREQPPTPDDSKSGKNGEPSPEEEAKPTLAELKLIRLTQLELLRRTIELEQVRAAEGDLDEARQRELDDLASRQRELAELLQSKVGPAQPQEDPASNPPQTESNRTPDSSRIEIRNQVRETVLVAWLQPLSSEQKAGSQKNPTPPPASPTDLNRALLDDLPPATMPAGEDLGQASDRSPWEQIGRQMREAGELLQSGKTAAETQQLQRRAAAQLTNLIDELQQQSGTSQPNESPNNRSEPMSQSPEASRPSTTASNKPGTGSTGSAGRNGTDSENVMQWARKAWGTLPDRVRHQIQTLSEEQFLPEYEEIIRQYYDRLSEHGRQQ